MDLLIKNPRETTIKVRNFYLNIVFISLLYLFSTATSLLSAASPVVVLNGPSESCVLANGVWLKATVTDSDGDLDRIIFHFRGPLNNPYVTDLDRHVVSLNNPVNGYNQAHFQLANIPPGQYIYYVDAYDDLNHRGRSGNVNGIRVGPGTHIPKVMVDDDYTRILHVNTSYNTWLQNPPNEHMNYNKLTAAIDHLASDDGIDTYIMNAGMGEFVYYKSTYYSIDDHIDFWQDATYPGNVFVNSIPYIAYVQYENRDPLTDAKDYLEANYPEKKFFIAVRMNDGHLYFAATSGLFNHETGDIYPAGERSRPLYRLYNRFKWLNPDFRIGEFDNLSEYGSSVQHLLDYRKYWTRTGVDEYGLEKCTYQHKIAIIRDILNNHETDGVLLDFCRLPFLFNPDNTNFAERLEVMTNLISSIRGRMDGKYYDDHGYAPQLAVRIPAFSSAWYRMGIDIKEWALSGVDIFVMGFQRAWYPPMYLSDGTLAPNYGPLKDETGEGSFFVHELNYASEFRETTLPSGEEYTVRRRTTEEQLLSCAYQAYRRNAEGVYLFNFPYYQGEDPDDDPEVKVEPLYYLAQELSSQSGSESPYFYYSLRQPNALDFPDMSLTLPLPVTATQSSWKEIKMYAPKPGSWPGMLRLRIEHDGFKGNLSVKVNGAILNSTSYISEPYGPPFLYTCDPDHTEAFRIPDSLMNNVDGILRIYVKLTTSGSRTIRWVDLSRY